MARSARQRETSPLILSSSDESAERLEPIPLGEPPFREGRLQRFLATHPEMLPVAEIEPAYAPLVCLGREIPTPSGFLDVLYVSPEGYPTLVEAKLWDNPEARRRVVGQIVEYARDFSRWGFEDLDGAVRRADHSSRGILKQVQQAGHDVKSSSFVDTVTQKLKRGEFLLLIVGNGIRKNVESLASYLQGAPNLHFSLRLVELMLFRMQEGQEWPLLVQPRVVTRTTEVTRAVVDVRAPDNVEVMVDLPSEDDQQERSGRQNLSEAAFFEQLAENMSPAVTEEVRGLIEEITDRGPEQDWGSSSVSLRLADPGSMDRHWTVVLFTPEGTFRIGWLKRISKDGGYDPEIWQDYFETVVDLTGAELRNMDSTEPEPIESLLEHREEFVAAAGRLVDRIEAEARERNA